MARKGKKKNKKAFRTIRKSIAALCMVTALIVAAIPVPDMQAVESIEVNGEQYYFATNDVSEKRENIVANDNRGTCTYNVTDADLDGELDPNNMLKKLPSDIEYNSYTICMLDNGRWEINWQFKFYLRENTSGITRGIISKYNDEYQEDTVTLTNQIVSKYYEVLPQDFIAFYDSAAGGASTEGNRTYIFSYDDDYIPYRTNNVETDVMKWFAKYRNEIYTAFLQACETYYNEKQKYDADYAQYLADLAAYEALPEEEKNTTQKPVPPTDITTPKPTQITVNPGTDFTEVEKMAYYCDFDDNLKQYGSGYTLVSVIDSRGDVGSTAQYTYIAANGTPIGTATNDKNGFLVIEESAGIMGIGNGAFKDVTNVDTLELPSQIGYIGDEAFMGSFLRNIVIQNVTYIGNKAFKDCALLSEVVIRGTKIIGTECFYNSGLTSVYLPYSVVRVDPGAFANCKKLTTVDLSDVANGCTIEKYAFYNCYSLNSVDMADSDISAIKEGVFAVSSGATGSWTDVVLPSHMTSTISGTTDSTLGNYLFAGRSNLNSVTFPSDYGRISEVVIPSGMFLNCANLSYVHFKDEGGGSCGYVKFEPNLFLDVSNPAFYIRGPEKSLNNKTALPRSSTWAAITNNLDNIPYVYVNSQGMECYEVSDGNYLLQANANGELTSCNLVGTLTDYIDLVIPSTVGSYEIKSIAEGCFADEELRQWIRSIKIEDNSVSNIGNRVFADLPALTSVEIGNSVNVIGNEAFKGCNKLEKVTFATPLSGYDAFSVGTDAFKTGGSKLHFYGDIVDNYAPFSWSMQPDNVIDDFGTRVCYTSLSPSYLTVMYDNSTKEVTLLDYPKYDQLDIDHASHNRGMENYYYQMYSSSEYDDERAAFINDWLADEATAYNSAYYGPWVNPSFCATYTSWSEDAMVSRPNAYYTQKPYSIRENYEKGSNALGVYQTTTQEEEAWIDACININVPKGVESIDVNKFITGSTANFRNVSTYLSDSAGYAMYTTAPSTSDAIPGLFSGYYQDFEGDSGYETDVKGNDRVESIVLNSVKSLPDYAFDDCERLKCVILGSECENIGTAPFRGCDTLTTVGGNEYYKYNNGIIYSINPDNTLTIEECLPSRGNPNNGIGQTMVDSTNDPDIANVSTIREGAFEDCEYVSSVDLGTSTGLTTIPESAFKSCESLAYVILPESVNRIESNAYAGNNRLDITIPGKEVFIASDALEHLSTVNVRTYEDSAALEYAKYYHMSYTIIGEKWRVVFLDYDGTQIGETQYIETGKSAVEPEHPSREGHEFLGWSDEFVNITEDTILVAQYKPVSNTTPDDDPNNGDNNNGNNNNNNNGNGDGNGGSGSGDNNNGNTNGAGNGNGNGNSTNQGMYSVTVEKGSGSGSYSPGATVVIVADDAASGYVFNKWETDSNIQLASVRHAATIFVMPASNVTVTATYTKSSGNGSSNNSGNNGNSSSGTVSGNNNNNTSTNTKVDINKNGISNSGLASANINGSTDKFVLKITDSISATDEVEKALKNEYGSLDNLRYYAMDISLYDSTGTTKIQDTTGLTADITIPIPDGLVAYGGNNKVAGVVNEKLDKLNPKFTTIDGVPCMTFRATHFSPYVVYVDTNNITQGVLDSTPKTGDGIHPKWFLSLGLACISVVLFMIREKGEKKPKLA